MTKFKLYLFLSQLCLYVPLIICSLIDNHVVITNGGVSNFGNYAPTVALYTTAFSLCTLFLWLAADKLIKLARHNLIHIAYSLALIGLLYLLVLLSTFPRHYSFVYSEAHDYLGIALYAIEFIFSLYLLISFFSYELLSAFIIEVAGMMMGLLSILAVVHFLYWGQVIGGVSFGYILVNHTNYLTTDQITAEHKNH